MKYTKLLILLGCAASCSLVSPLILAGNQEQAYTILFENKTGTTDLPGIDVLVQGEVREGTLVYSNDPNHPVDIGCGGNYSTPSYSLNSSESQTWTAILSACQFSSGRFTIQERESSKEICEITYHFPSGPTLTAINNNDNYICNIDHQKVTIAPNPPNKQ